MKTLICTFIIAILLFAIDFFILRHYLAHTFWLDIYRTYYFLTGCLSHICIMNRYFRKQRLLKEKIDKEILEDDIRNYKIKNNLK